MWSKDRIFVWDAKTLVRTLNKMNNSRPIIKISFFPIQNTPNVFFSSNFANFFILPAHKNATYAKMVFRLRIGKLRSFYHYIREYYSGAKTEKEKNFQKDWKNK